MREPSTTWVPMWRKILDLYARHLHQQLHTRQRLPHLALPAYAHHHKCPEWMQSCTVQHRRETTCSLRVADAPGHAQAGHHYTCTPQCARSSSGVLPCNGMPGWAVSCALPCTAWLGCWPSRTTRSIMTTDANTLTHLRSTPRTHTPTAHHADAHDRIILHPPSWSDHSPAPNKPAHPNDEHAVAAQTSRGLRHTGTTRRAHVHQQQLCVQRWQSARGCRARPSVLSQGLACSRARPRVLPGEA